MAVKKSAAPKAKDVSASKKAGGTKKSAAKKEAAPKKSAAVAKKSAAPKTAAPKAAAKKKAAAAPIKLTSSQSDILKKVGAAADPGYKLEKKAEQRTLDALLERKLIKKGAKDKATGGYHYQISNTGKKHAGASGGETPPPAPPAGTP